MLIVLGILLVLMGLIVVAFRGIGDASNTNQTRVRLANARNMLAEYEMSAGMREIIGLYPASPGNIVAAPVDVMTLEGGSIERFDADAVTLTQAVMRLLVATPANREMVRSLPADALLGPVAGVRPASLVVTPPVPAPVTSNSQIDPPVLVDAWNNPIIYVPAGGLSGVLFESTGTTNQRVTSRGVIDNTAATPAQSRPFFASAGPDGRFDRGDDNVYSFEE